MTGNVEHLLFEQRKCCQPTLDRVEGKLDDLTGRVSNLEGGQAAVIRHLGHLAAADATRQVGMDRLRDRLDRIERRLQLVG